MKPGGTCLWGVLALVILTCVGCGKKAPPFLPEKAPVQQVEGLQGKLEDGGVLLTGRIPEGEEGSPPISGCVVYHAQYPTDAPPCETCPVRWERLKPIQEAVVFQERFQCKVLGINTPGIHFIRVRLLGQGGTEGPPSKRLRLTFPDRPGTDRR